MLKKKLKDIFVYNRKYIFYLNFSNIKYINFKKAFLSKDTN